MKILSREVNNTKKRAMPMVSGRFNIVTSINDNSWDEFVIKHPQGNIFQSRHMYEVYRNARNYHPIKLFAVNSANGEICGVLSSVIVDELGGLLSKLSAHSIIQGGPLVSPGQEKVISPLLVAEHDKLSCKKALYSEVRNMYEVKENLAGLDNYLFEDHLNYLINLGQSEETLWHQLHRAKKNHINKARKLNMVIGDLENKEMLNTFYKLVSETYRNARIPLAHISLFESAYEVLAPRGLVKFVFAKYKDRYVASQVFLLYKKVIYAWYAGALREYLNCHPNEYITWNVLKWGILNGYQLFDFGGGGNPGVRYGPRDYKREFGGQEVNFGRHKLVYQPIRMKITDIGFILFRKLAFLNLFSQ